MYLTIKSRKLDREFRFFMSDAGGYVHLDVEGDSRRQICDGGGYTGSTVRSSPQNFEHDCRSWYRAHMRQNEAM